METDFGHEVYEKNPRLIIGKKSLWKKKSCWGEGQFKGGGREDRRRKRINKRRGWRRRRKRQG